MINQQNIWQNFWQKLTPIQNDFRTAASILTRIPMPHQESDTARPLASSYWAFPLIGVVVAGIAALPAMILYSFSIPATVLAAVMLAIAAVVTGGLHEDGLADLADSFGGGDSESRLHIMRDSRIGAFGVLALIFTIAINLACLADLAMDGMTAILGAWVAASVVSRSMMALQSHYYPAPDTTTGFSASVGQPDQRTMLISLGGGFIISVLFIGPAVALIGFALSALATLGLGMFINRHIGGVNGDSLGATQQCVTTIMLIVASVILS